MLDVSHRGGRSYLVSHVRTQAYRSHFNSLQELCSLPESQGKPKVSANSLVSKTTKHPILSAAILCQPLTCWYRVVKPCSLFEGTHFAYGT